MVAGRRSVRTFTADPVAEEDVNRIVEAALAAPSSKNTRSSGFMIVGEPELIGRIARMRDYGS